jgi:hypothetical protein
MLWRYEPDLTDWNYNSMILSRVTDSCRILVGQGLPIVEASPSHSDTPH